MDNQILFISFNCGGVAGLSMLTDAAVCYHSFKKPQPKQQTKYQKMPKTVASSLSYCDY